MAPENQKSAAGLLAPRPRERLVQELVSRYVEVHQRVPDRVYAAPGRVNLMGDHTDYNDGLCLPIALPYAAYAAVGIREDGLVDIRSVGHDGTFRADLDSLNPQHMSGWSAYAAGVVWSALQDDLIAPGLEILISGDVPEGAGLSSSAALGCVIALAVADGSGLELDEETRRSLVEITVRAEQLAAGAPTGGMDQTVSLLGRPGHAMLLDCRSGRTDHIPFRPLDDDLELLIIDTGVRRSLNDGRYAARRRECEQAAEMLDLVSLREADMQALGTLSDAVLRRRARHVVTEIARVREAVDALSRADYQALGHLLDESHASLRDDFGVSCPELDLACEVATNHGALGARMTGGGFGGCAIALAPSPRASGIRETITQAFERRSFPTPRFLTGAPAAGATRIESTHGSELL